jgi:molybdopterin converting factor small subunit
LSVATVRFFAGARAASGRSTETVDVGSVKELLDILGERSALARILPACTVLVDGLSCHEPTVALTRLSTVDILPPFAGG